MTPEERWAELTVRIDNEIFRVRGAKDMEEWVIIESMIVAFHRVQQIMKVLEEK
jgi:hypothetical protein